MKKQAVCLLLVLLFGSAVFALEDVEVKPYFKLGTLRGNEHNHPEGSGRKFYIGSGVDFQPTDKDFMIDSVTESFGVEVWAMSEPTDEDRELVSDGLVGYFEVEKEIEVPEYLKAVKVDGLSVFARYDVTHWKRNGNLANPDAFWGDLLFFNLIFGGEVTTGKLTNRVGAILPTFINADSGGTPAVDLGYTWNIDYALYETIKVGFYYDRYNFDMMNLKLCGAKLTFLF